MRSWAISRSGVALSVRVMAAHSEKMAGGKGEVGAVQRVEVELLDAFALQAAAEVASYRGGDHPAGFDVVVEALEHLGEPGWHLGAAQARHPGDALEVRHRHDAGHDRHLD